MMTCKEYVFKLTSGQLEEAGRLERFWAGQHRLICRRCRAFTRNDQRLDGILAGYQERLMQADDQGPSSGPINSRPGEP